ncbi:hypothetical protein L0F63_001135 [Massospora cicadina]|nr:hypothetical protein L0F63_001135 [Massospora cicadina]
MWIALADFIFCGLSYLNVKMEKVISCNLITSVGYISNLTYIFLTVCMAFDLQLVFVQQQHNPWLMEKFYVGTSFLAVVVIVLPFTIIAAAMDNWMFWLIIGLWEVGGVVYCSVTIIRVVLKLTHFHDDISGLEVQGSMQGSTLPTVNQISDSTQSRVEQVVRHSVFYPLVPVLTQTPYIITANFSLLNEGNKSLIESLLNAAIFLFDPALPKILKDLHIYIHAKYQKDTSQLTRFIARIAKLPEDTNSHQLSKQSQSIFNFSLSLDLCSTRSSLYSTNSTKEMSENQVTLLL